MIKRTQTILRISLPGKNKSSEMGASIENV
jgi:hypothetical protein